MGSYTQQQQPPYIGRDPVVIVQDTQHSKLVCILHLDYVHRAMEAPSGGCWLEAAAGTAEAQPLPSKSAMELLLAGLLLVMCVSVCVCGALLSSIEPLIFVHISLKQHQSVLS